MFKIKKSRLRKKFFRAKIHKIGSLLCSFPRLSVGTLGIKANEFGLVPINALIAFFQEINKKIKKHGFCRIYVFPHCMKTNKKKGSRMGQGKGPDWSRFGFIYPGMLLCSLTLFAKQKGLLAFKAARYKLPISCSLIEY